MNGIFPRWGWVMGLVLRMACVVGRAENIEFPADAGVLDVTKAPYFAKGDGHTDCTEALQQAFQDNPSANRIIYLPNGRYLVSATLRWPWHTNLVHRYRSTILQGQSRDGVVLQLADRSAGFQKGNRPRPILWTGERGSPRQRNAIRNLTIDTGHGNPMAIGVQFFCSKQGGIRDVLVRSPDGSGISGIDMSHSDETGPCYVRDVRVEGFEFGLRTGYAYLGATFENLELVGQSDTAIRNIGQSLTLRNLRSTNRVQAIQSSEGNGFITLIDAVLQGEATNRPTSAIQNRGIMFARRLSTPGYAKSVENRTGTGTDATGPDVREFLSHRLFSLYVPSPQYSLDLPVRETPTVPWDPIGDWVSPLAFGGKPNDGTDDSAAIQKAIDAGKPTVYLPNGTWTIHQPVIVRGAVRRLIGCEARVRLDHLGARGAFIIADGASPVVVLERLDVETFEQSLVSQESGRTLVLSSCNGVRGRFPGKGDLFLEDVHFARMLAITNKSVWGRQVCLDHEGGKIFNSGGTLWMLGLTTERGGVVVRTADKGRTEILGGMVNSTGGWKDEPMFRIDDASASFVVPEASFSVAPYMTIVREKRGEQVKTLPREGLPGLPLPTHAGGIGLPLYTGYSTSGR